MSGIENSDRYQPCEECGDPVDTTEPGVWKAPNDEQWWHEDCYDPIERVELIVEDLRRMETHEVYPSDLQTAIRTAAGRLESAAKRARLKREQDIRTDGGTSGREQTRVGHCRYDDVDHYVGRGPGDANLNTAAIVVRGWLGNPYPVGDEYTREESIEHFRADFEARLDAEEDFREAVADLAGSVLGCWCQRLDEDEPACHAEIIAEHADRLASELHTVSEHGGGGP